MKRKINAILASLLFVFAGAISCAKTDPGVEPTPTPDPGPGPGPDPITPSLFVSVELSSYESAGGTTPDEDLLKNLRACLFEEGQMVAIYDHPTDSEKGFGFEIDRNDGTLYVLNLSTDQLDLNKLLAEGCTEEEWLSTYIGIERGTPIQFISGSTEISSDRSNSIRLSRGFARFDLRIRTVGKAEIKSLTWENCALQTRLFSNNEIEDSESGQITTHPSSPFTEDTEGVAYLYEQQNPEALLRAEAIVHGKPCLLEAKIPAQIQRNHIYTITLTKDEADQDIQFTIESWENGEDTNLYPDLGQQIVIDTEQSELPLGAEISGDGARLTLSHSHADFLLVLDCNDELEIIPSEMGHLTIEAIGTTRGVPGKNRFRISKPLYTPGMAAEELDIQFRRKGLNNIYPEDRLTIRLLANPVRLEGEIAFDIDSYAFDFDRYVDNELGRFILPAEKELQVEFPEGEDAWIQLVPSEESNLVIRVLGGWRPNDPKADGRIQEATLVICNAADGSERECYRISRRNYGLPVTWFHGVWWCKYNARGNSRDFEDQILCTSDPAALVGKNVLDYLRDCSAEEFYELWGWAYQGDSGKGMRVIEKDGILVMDGFSTSSSVHINKLPATTLAPDGYELPSMEEFNRIFDATDYVWVMWSGSHQLRNPWNGHSRINREQRRRNDLTIGSVQATDLLYIGMSSPDFPEHEAIVWYGPGAQWNNDGIKHSNHYNNILFGVYSPEGSGWYMAGSMAGLYLTQNGAGTKDTRVLRFKKSPVEYIY